SLSQSIVYRLSSESAVTVLTERVTELERDNRRLRGTAQIDECFAYADALKDREIDARVVVEAVDRDEIETGVRGPVEVRAEGITHPAIPENIPEPAQEGAVEVTYETLGDLVQSLSQSIVYRLSSESAVTVLTERVTE
nr:hypothetical protein [Tanacetum cinerariifolium]